MYGIVGIRSVGAHLLQIDFAGSVPDAYGDLELYTDGGILATTLPGWETVYRTDGKTVYLSDDGASTFTCRAGTGHSDRAVRA